jgi:Alkylmercury lyase
VNDLDNRVRLHIYTRFVADGRPPTVEETARALEIGAKEAAATYERLQQARVIVLAPGTATVWMAAPFSSVPTRFRVVTDDGRSWWGNCAWDALGVLALLGADGLVDASCPDCGERIELRVASGDLEPVEAVVHFSVPARRWWENIGFT